jgi:hypothetical protein
MASCLANIVHHEGQYLSPSRDKGLWYDEWGRRAGQLYLDVRHIGHTWKIKVKSGQRK